MKIDRTEDPALYLLHYILADEYDYEHMLSRVANVIDLLDKNCRSADLSAFWDDLEDHIADLENE